MTALNSSLRMLQTAALRSASRSSAASATSTAPAGRFLKPLTTRSKIHPPLTVKQQQHRWVSSTIPDHSGDGFQPQPPQDGVNLEMALALQQTMQAYMEYGVSAQRLDKLCQTEMPVVQKWQLMMEIYFTTQLHIVTGFGYATDESGLMHYMRDFSKFLDATDDENIQLSLRVGRREAWRTLVSKTFGIDMEKDAIPEMTIVDARNHMHKVATKMQTPEILFQIQQNVSRITYAEDPNIEQQMKHGALQDIIVNHVYLGDAPNSIVEQAGCGPGAKGYAKFQCALGDFEGDPLIGEYTVTAMKKMFEAAGLEATDMSGNNEAVNMHKVPAS